MVNKTEQKTILKYMKKVGDKSEKWIDTVILNVQLLKRLKVRITQKNLKKLETKGIKIFNMPNRGLLVVKLNK